MDRSQIQRSSQRNDRGFVLVSTIWICGLLAIALTAFIIKAKTNTLLARVQMFSEKAEVEADGMVRLLAFRLASRQIADRSGQLMNCLWPDGTTIQYSIQDQAGLLDLNTANPELMAAAIRELSHDPNLAQSLLEEWGAFKSSKTWPASSKPPSLQARKGLLPKGAPFETPAELDQLPSMTDHVERALRQITTVYSQAPGIDFTLSPETLVQIVKRQGPEFFNFNSPSPSKAFAINVLAELREGTRFSRKAIIALTNQPNKPFTILDWEQGDALDLPSRLPATTSTCIKSAS